MTKIFLLTAFIHLSGMIISVSDCDRDKLVLKRIYFSHKKIVKGTGLDKPNYSSIVAFGKYERHKLYKDSGLTFQKTENVIVLEGFAVSSGHHIGFFIVDDDIVYYSEQNDNKWLVKRFYNDITGVENASGVNKKILHKVKQWDINFLEKIKESFGYSVKDGYSFIASKVSCSDLGGIESVAFEEINSRFLIDQ